jgi:hypothetical protein
MTDANYRLRVGDWRVICALRDDLLVVLVLRVGVVVGVDAEAVAVIDEAAQAGDLERRKPAMEEGLKELSGHVVLAGHGRRW